MVVYNKVAINKVRHLKNISIPLSENQIKYLILTGKNGSGKTNVVEVYYDVARVFQTEQPRQIEKVKLQDYYGLTEFPRKEFVKYLLDLKMTEALARSNNKTDWIMCHTMVLLRVFWS